LLPVLFMACGTQPKMPNEAAEEEVVAVMPVKEAAENKSAADTQNLGDLKEEAYEDVLNNVKAFIENLNKIIKNGDFDKWKEALSQERYKEISSPEFLANVSNMEAMKNRGVTVNTEKDYFFYVVVPSRANSQVDKIEILDNNKVRAIYMSSRRVVSGNKTRTETVPLLVYELAKTKDSWKIIR